MAKKKVADPEVPVVWKDAILVLQGDDGGWDNRAKRTYPGLGETARSEVPVSVRPMVYEDYRRDCDLIARSYARRLNLQALALEIENHRRHKDGDLDAAGSTIAAPASCANWIAARAWADALEAVVKGKSA